MRTDHASLAWIRNFKNPEGMLARWLSIVDMYDFELSTDGVVYITMLIVCLVNPHVRVRGEIVLTVLYTRPRLAWVTLRQMILHLLR